MGKHGMSQIAARRATVGQGYINSQSLLQRLKITKLVIYATFQILENTWSTPHLLTKLEFIVDLFPLHLIKE